MNRVILYVANAARWFDRANGNTYHSVNVTRCQDGQTLYCPMEYGYGEHYRQTALEAMAAAGWLPAKYTARNANGSSEAHNYERENNHPILWNVTDGLKRDCIRNGEKD